MRLRSWPECVPRGMRSTYPFYRGRLPGDVGIVYKSIPQSTQNTSNTIRAVRVRLQNGGAVEGDIFHPSLSIDEDSQFEGSSRRVENPTDLPSVEAKGPQEEDMQNSALAPYLQRVEAPASTDWSESAAEPKH